jgi:hypothetical protein
MSRNYKMNLNEWTPLLRKRLYEYRKLRRPTPFGVKSSFIGARILQQILGVCPLKADLR